MAKTASLILTGKLVGFLAADIMTRLSPGDTLYEGRFDYLKTWRVCDVSFEQGKDSKNSGKIS